MSIFKIVLVTGIITLILYKSTSFTRRQSLFNIAVMLTFVREMKLNPIGDINVSLVIFFSLLLFDLPRLPRKYLSQFAIVMGLLIIGSIITLITSNIGLVQISKSFLAFLTPFLILNCAIIYVRNSEEHTFFVKSYIVTAAVISISGTAAFLGYYDDIIVFGYRGAGSGVVTSQKFGISYSNSIYVIPAVMIPYLWEIKLRSIFRYILALTFVFVVIISLKRIAILALLLTATSLLRKSGSITIKALLIGAIIWVGFADYIEFSSVFDRFNQSNVFSDNTTIDNSTQIRLNRYMGAWNSFMDNIFFGLGVGKRIYLHNGFLEILVAFGLFGYLYIHFLFRPIWKLVQNKHIYLYRSSYVIVLLTLFSFEAAISRVDLMYHIGILMSILITKWHVLNASNNTSNTHF